MEKEKILSEIKGKLGETSFSERTLDTYIELNPIADGQEPDEAYFTKAVSFLKSMQGQYDHDVKIKVEDFKKNYKPEPDPDPDKEDREESQPNKEIEELTKKLKAIEERMKAEDDGKKHDELLAKVKDGMKLKNADDAYVLEKTLQGVRLDASKSVDELVSDMLSRYDAEYKACRGDGASPRQNRNKGGGASDSYVKSYFKNKAKKEGWDKK